MVPQPPFFKVGAKQKQIIRIMKTDSSLPTDRESLFWLNVQEVPPKPDVKRKPWQCSGNCDEFQSEADLSSIRS